MVIAMAPRRWPKQARTGKRTPGENGIARRGCLDSPHGLTMVRPASPHDGRRELRGLRSGHLCPKNAFTLVELLAVLAIVGILTAVVFTAADGARERSRRHRAAAELATLAHGLESYRVRFGDYPATGPAPAMPDAVAATDDAPGILLNALAGRRGPGAELFALEARALVDLATLALQTEELPDTGVTTQVANAFLDPWGRRYVYFYRTGAAWRARTPVLLSAGPDGVVALPGELASWDGSVDDSLPANADNLRAL